MAKAYGGGESPAEEKMESKIPGGMRPGAMASKVMKPEKLGLRKPKAMRSVKVVK